MDFASALEDGLRFKAASLVRKLGANANPTFCLWRDADRNCVFKPSITHGAFFLKR